MRKHAEEVTDKNFISNTQYVICVSPDIARKTTDLMIYLDIYIKKTIILCSDYDLQL
jgi:hypothetical protein